MKSPDDLPNHIRNEYFGLGEEDVMARVKSAKRHHDQGRTVPMSDFLDRTELRENYPIPLPLYTVPPPSVKRK